MSGDPSKKAASQDHRPSGAYIQRMPSYDFITFEVADRIATITVNRPDKLNALNSGTIAELGAAIDDARVRQDVGGVILTGAGRAFIAGADISELQGQSPFVAKGRSRAGQEVFRRYEMCPKPVIAAVNGFALGGGCEIAMACHVRIASEHAKFGQPEVKLGILPGYGGTQRLPRLIGKGRALQLLMTGEMIDAEEALRIGLVNRVVHAAELLGAAQIMLKQIMQNAPLAVALSIEAVDRGLGMTLDEGLTLEANHFGLLAATDDMKEGMSAFLEKRTPGFNGR
jgi:enoyl-CoA hydratase